MAERGPYATPNRVLELERHVARIEGRLLERIDQLEQELARQRAAQLDLFRGLTGAFINVLRDQLGSAPPVALHQPREEEG